MKVLITEEYGFNLSVKALKQLVLRSAPCMILDNELLGFDELVTDVGDGFTQGFLNQVIAYKGQMYVYNDDRIDPILHEVVLELGDEAAMCGYGKLKIVEIPDNVKYYIEENESGSEVIHEQHRTWQ